MKRCGFTLVELLVVLAVGSILLAIAVPGYGFLANTSRVAAVTNDLVAALHLARSEAIKRGIQVTVCKTSNTGAGVPVCDVAANWHEGWLVFVDGGAPGVIDLDDEVLRIQNTAYPAVTITTGINYSRYVSYLPSGQSRGLALHNGTIHICVSGIRRDIIINITGRPRLVSGSC